MEVNWLWLVFLLDSEYTGARVILAAAVTADKTSRLELAHSIKALQ